MAVVVVALLLLLVMFAVLLAVLAVMHGIASTLRGANAVLLKI